MPAQRRVLAIVVFGGTLLVSTALALGLVRMPEDLPRGPRASPPGPFDDLPAGWTRLPAPPEVRSVGATVWTGDRLIVWGGHVYTGFSDEQPQKNGFLFDARSRGWSPIARGPLGPRILPAAVWTGSEMLIWGGTDEEGETFLSDGAAYEPESDSWRILPPAPIGPRAPLFVWTGRELLVWGTAVRVAERPVDGAAFDPATYSWRKIAEAPIELTDATAVWTGKEMIVFGAALHGGNVPETKTAIGAAYDPASDAWRRLPKSNLSPQASTAAWTGRELVAWDYLHATAAYDPADDEWRRIPRVPLEDYECSPKAVAVAGYAIGDYCGATALYDPAGERWRDISLPRFAGWGFQVVAADPVVLLLGRHADSGEERMLAYRPEADAADEE